MSQNPTYYLEVSLRRDYCPDFESSTLKDVNIQQFVIITYDEKQWSNSNLDSGFDQLVLKV